MWLNWASEYPGSLQVAKGKIRDIQERHQLETDTRELKGDLESKGIA